MQRSGSGSWCWQTRDVDIHVIVKSQGDTDVLPICAAMAAVADVDVLYSTLRAAGVTFGRPPENQSWGARMVGHKDLDGNNLNLLQKL